MVGLSLFSVGALQGDLRIHRGCGSFDWLVQFALKMSRSVGWHRQECLCHIGEAGSVGLIVKRFGIGPTISWSDGDLAVVRGVNRSGVAAASANRVSSVVIPSVK
jgi:hypothetical protein